MNGPLRVAVIGCGTAGAAAALFLARAGHEVTVFERVPEPGPIGAGIMMQPSGLLVLERLHLAGRILSRGARVTRLVCETQSGRSLLDLRYEALEAGLFGVGLHRGVLFETLFGALQESQARLLCGVAIERLCSAPGDRVSLCEAGGARHGAFDLALVCDGARSRVRDGMVALAKSVRPYPWGALWFIGRDRDARHSGRLHQIVSGTRRMVGLLPTGLGPRASSTGAFLASERVSPRASSTGPFLASERVSPRASSTGAFLASELVGPGDAEDPLVSLFVSTPASEVAAIRARGLGPWKEAVRDLAPMASPVLDQLTSFDQLTFAAYYDVTLPRWHAHRVALLGDAAHATSPQLGQGCNLALCDAAALADAVEAEPTVARALDRYTASRRDHLAFYQLATRWLTPFFQSDYELLGLARDALFGPASAIGLVEREMVRSMAGTKTGIFFGSIETRMPKGVSASAPAQIPLPSPP